MRYLRIVVSGLVLLGLVGMAQAASDATTDKKSVALTPDKAADKKQKDIIAMAEEFGLIVGPVTEDIRKELNLRSAEGVAVFEVIGDSLAELAGIKDRKSTRLNSSHGYISYAVFCLKKKKIHERFEHAD